ncbi:MULTISPECIES: FkbM family methyltransferase [unclassified Bradyrhizobium]|uniref:FkbM family methyltransferase n=1 Tax=unclassified Bradyrhizobium TaxID=2631580 RepID=UPI001FF82183|nr:MULTISPECIES: FkbM family methyltransferase [unclassified Bradyrhizobium]MCK1328792.1 FkbM family methyltransferase [Bradyrhizobium sp. CW9]MCK1693432.1 FkbM family methyltransferase [Bradyrhizobium sp. 144]
MSQPDIKKVLRTLQVQFPGLVEAKFAVHDGFFRSTGLLYKSDYRGLRHFDLAGRVLLDVGANRGQSITAFKNAVDRPKIIAFEPNARLAANLAQRYIDDEDVSVLEVALCEREREFDLHLPYYKGFMLDGLASLKLEEARDWPNAERFYFFNPRQVKVETYRVQGKTLDSFGFEPALIKLSIQRSEIEALMGAAETLSSCRPIIMSAWPWPTLIAYLADRGYSYYGYLGGRFVPGRLSYMNWFLLEEHKAQVSHLLAI